MENNFQPSNFQSNNSTPPVVTPPIPPKQTLLSNKKDAFFLGGAVLAVIITVAIIFTSLQGTNPLSFFSNISLPSSDKKIAEMGRDYVNNNLLQGQTATLLEYTRESGIIKLKLQIGESSYDSYITKDGKYFFPEGFNLKDTAQ